ncbi:hypothetical protein CEXT_611781 [Caerostris extrusa]|uniref:Uncharacterized protein n=1 Tax=Caerostris extrusa TaxID=172846 RepID=A0AAV4U148_CAEEX|nr:hypothetical protein CEXT_611781 [Caerostris extrusa]
MQKNACFHFSAQLELPPVIKITLRLHINPSLSTPIAPVSPFVFRAWGWGGACSPHHPRRLQCKSKISFAVSSQVINDAFMSLLWALMSPDTMCPGVIIMKVMGTTWKDKQCIFWNIFCLDVLMHSLLLLL